MTPRQRAYALAAERGVTLHPAMNGSYMEGVGLVGPTSAKMVDRQKVVLTPWWEVDGYPPYSGFCPPEPPRRLWLRVCAVLEAMPVGAHE